MADTFRALLLEQQGDTVQPAIRDLTTGDLMAGDVTVRVAYSSVNYKDGLAVRNQGRIIRTFPFIPGIDLAGTVESSDSPRFAPGDAVVLTGNGVGERHFGGFAQRARLKAEWLVKLPDGLSPLDAMTLGTAGFTAMQCVEALEQHGLAAGREILVTGAAGGVGSVAVALLSRLGHTVVASTGRPETEPYLRSLGAAGILERSALQDPKPRPLASERWGGAVDTVGGLPLANLLPAMAYGTAVTACGNAAGLDVPTTVIPFILRGVSLIGIDSVQYPNDRRPALWHRLADTLPADVFSTVRTIIPLADLPTAASDILAGKVRGRLVVDVNG